MATPGNPGELQTGMQVWFSFQAHFCLKYCFSPFSKKNQASYDAVAHQLYISPTQITAQPFCALQSHLTELMISRIIRFLLNNCSGQGKNWGTGHVCIVERALLIPAHSPVYLNIPRMHSRRLISLAWDKSVKGLLVCVIRTTVLVSK